MESLEYINTLFSEGKYDECIELLSNSIKNNKLSKTELTDFLSLRGDIYRKLNKLGDALRDYRSILSIDKDNVSAMTKIGMVENILSIENTFYYENAYTDETLFPEM